MNWPARSAASRRASRVEVTVWRDGKTETKTRRARQAAGDDQQASADEAAPERDRAELARRPRPDGRRADDGKGLVVTDVDPDSDAAERGIQAGDVITAVNSKAVESAGDVKSAMGDAAKSGRKAVLFQVTRDDTNRFVALPIAKG